MEYIAIGKYVNTHGIKGEIRILSHFRHKDLVFQKGIKIFIGKEKKQFSIVQYRKHKDYDMVTLEGITNINEILSLKGSMVYIEKDTLNLKGRLPFPTDFIGFEVVMNTQPIGTIIEVMELPANDVLVVSEKRILIPYVDLFVKTIDMEHKKITMEMEGFQNEN